MSGQAPYGYQLEPTVVEGIRTKKMVADPVAADHVRLMFEMYAEPETSFGDITRYFEEHDIKIYGKSMFRTFLSQLLYAQSPLALQELVGPHPKPFDRVAPAGRNTPATRHKAPRPRQCASEGFRIFYAMCNCSFNARCKT